jgi:hypothetical protein
MTSTQEETAPIDGSRAPAHLPWMLRLLLAGLAIYLVSPAGTERGFYFADWFNLDRGLAGAGLARWLALTLLLVPALGWGRLRAVTPLLLLAACGVIALCAMKFFGATQGLALHRDDHPSMMFRLWLVLHTFPQAVNYSPFWNGGVLDSTPITSGIQGLALLLWPFWKSLPVHEAYTPGIGILYLLVLPALAALAVRLAGGDRRAALVAALLGLGISRHFFLWALHFGTVGASLAMAFVMPVAGALYRVVVLQQRGRWTAVILTLCLFFTLQWPPGALMLAVLGLGVLVGIRPWNLRTVGFLAGCGAVALLLDVNGLRAILDKSTSPLSFTMQQTPEKAAAQPDEKPVSEPAAAPSPAQDGWRKLRAHAVEAHPLLVFLGLGGALFAGGAPLRRFFGPVLLGFAALGAWGPMILPNLQVERLVLPGLFAAVIPAALLTGRVLAQESRASLLPRAALLSLLVMGGQAVSRIYANQTTAPFITLNDQVRTLVAQVKNRTPADGRVLFAGSMVHAVGRGHVAYLPVLTGAEMMACDYYHFPPKMVEYNYPPRAFRTNDAVTARFMDLYDVTHVVTFRRDWLKYFAARPDTYEKVGQVDDLELFRVLRPPNRFLQGQGKVRATMNRIEVELADGHAEAVIKYNWIKGLRAEPPAEIYPFEALPGLTLTGIRPHGARHVVITYDR